MPTYAISAKRSVQKALATVPKRQRERLITAIGGLEEDPRPEGFKTLDSRKKVYRIRVGDYRVIYQVRDAELVVLVVTVGDRREVYRRLQERIKRLE